jgi:hypothetical protein
MTAGEATLRAEVDQYCAVRPERLTVRPAGGGRFTIHVRWRGGDSILRAVFVRRLLARPASRPTRRAPRAGALGTCVSDPCRVSKWAR